MGDVGGGSGLRLQLAPDSMLVDCVLSASISEHDQPQTAYHNYKAAPARFLNKTFDSGISQLGFLGPQECALDIGNIGEKPPKP